MLKRSIKFEYLKKTENRHLLSHFQFTLEEYENLDWEEAHEFKLQSEKFDVIETLVHSDGVELWCFRDRKEELLDEEIKESLVALLGAHTPSQKKQPEPQKQDLKCLPRIGDKSSITLTAELLIPVSFKHIGYTAPIIGTDLPPPERTS